MIVAAVPLAALVAEARTTAAVCADLSKRSIDLVLAFVHISNYSAEPTSTPELEHVTSKASDNVQFS